MSIINIWGDARNITLTAYLAKGVSAKRPKPAMVICPGGAYRQHADHEGQDYAAWLNCHGIDCFVLAYRLGSQAHHHAKEPLHDLVRAMKLVRLNAQTWNIDPHRVGVMGSSAGGHLASLLLTHFDEGNLNSNDLLERQSSRPNLGVLCYPLISMETEPHLVSRANLLGDAPPKNSIRSFSSELQVTNKTPPCFIWHTFADASVKVSHSLAFASALNKAQVPFELHVYQTGRHGMGLDTSHPWSQSCLDWLKLHGFIGREH